MGGLHGFQVSKCAQGVESGFAGLGWFGGPQRMIYDSDSMFRDTMLHAPGRLLHAAESSLGAAGSEK